MGNLFTQIRWERILGSFLSPETVKLANRCLSIAAAFVAALFLWKLFLGSGESEFQKTLSEGRRMVTDKAAVLAMPKRDDQSLYEKQVSDRMIFKASSDNPAAIAGDPNVQAPSLKDIILIGVLPSDKPQAILEDRRIQKTYYLSEHQTANNLTVEELNGNTVTVRRGSETRKFTQ